MCPLHFLWTHHLNIYVYWRLPLFHVPAPPLDETRVVRDSSWDFADHSLGKATSRVLRKENISNNSFEDELTKMQHLLYILRDLFGSLPEAAIFSFLPVPVKQRAHPPVPWLVLSIKYMLATYTVNTYNYYWWHIAVLIEDVNKLISIWLSNGNRISGKSPTSPMFAFLATSALWLLCVQNGYY